jgi:site-specific recombinase XerD
VYDILSKKQQTGNVFQSSTGTQIKASNLGREYRKALKKASISNMKFHDLRHSFASRMVGSGVDLGAVKALLGHSDFKSTLRYSHYSTASLKNAMSLMEAQKTIS